jgi:hypothetical protein
MLILGGTLDLIYGRRYGFVGRNGLGRQNLIFKSTRYLFIDNFQANQHYFVSLPSKTNTIDE